MKIVVRARPPRVAPSASHARVKGKDITSVECDVKTCDWIQSSYVVDLICRKGRPSKNSRPSALVYASTHMCWPAVVFSCEL